MKLLLACALFGMGFFGLWVLCCAAANRDGGLE